MSEPYVYRPLFAEFKQVLPPAQPIAGKGSQPKTKLLTKPKKP